MKLQNYNYSVFLFKSNLEIREVEIKWKVIPLQGVMLNPVVRHYISFQHCHYLWLHIICCCYQHQSEIAADWFNHTTFIPEPPCTLQTLKNNGHQCHWENRKCWVIKMVSADMSPEICQDLSCVCVCLLSSSAWFRTSLDLDMLFSPLLIVQRICNIWLFTLHGDKINTCSYKTKKKSTASPPVWRTGLASS